MEDRHFLIGTAGHVDHGKTELIRALTGIETDRLKEEKQRGISIELGFAHMTLPSGRSVGIVDVPGHERFVRQMLAGASGMDVVLLVIAADEGIMPQTREHLSILNLLGIKRGIVVLSKIDLVDTEWQELIVEEIRTDLAGTLLEDAPLCPVSAVTGAGIPELIQIIEDQLDEAESKKADGPVRMPLDRVFSVQGFGTVVTGTLYSGTVELGQELTIEPGHLLTKVRSLQVHGTKVILAFAGQRVAINLAGVEVAEVEKGAVLATPKAFEVGNILDLKLLNLASADKPIVQRQRVRFHLGTSEVLGRIHLLEHEELVPGAEGYAQILLESPVLAASEDRFVLRFYSPAFTIAGGKVLGVSERKQKRFKEGVLAQMALKDQGDPLQLLEKELNEPRSLSELGNILHAPEAELKELLGELKNQERLEIWQEEGSELFWAKDPATAWRGKLGAIVKQYEQEYPLRLGLGREELKAGLGVSWGHRRWQMVLEEGAKRGYYRISGGKVQSLAGAELSPGIAQRLDCLRGRWHEARLTPPELEAIAADCGIPKGSAVEYAQYLLELGEWSMAGGFYFEKQVLEEGKKALVTYLNEHGEVTVADVRELWSTSRKYAVPLLEFFDQQKITRRMGDKRIKF